MTKRPRGQAAGHPLPSHLFFTPSGKLPPKNTIGTGPGRDPCLAREGLRSSVSTASAARAGEQGLRASVHKEEVKADLRQTSPGEPLSFYLIFARFCPCKNDHPGPELKRDGGDLWATSMLLLPWSGSGPLWEYRPFLVTSHLDDGRAGRAGQWFPSLSTHLCVLGCREFMRLPHRLAKHQPDAWDLNLSNES